MTKIKKVIKQFLTSKGIVIFRNSELSRQLNISARIICLSLAKGVIHIGAHFGQERDEYRSYGLPVLWIEGDPSTFKILKNNLSGFVDQKCVCALLGKEDSNLVDFHITDNEGASSSILEFEDESGIELKQSGSKKLPLNRLDSIMKEKQISDYDFWVIDVQGAELDVLQGAGELLKHANFVQIETSTFFHYKNQPLHDTIENFLQTKGFNVVSRPEGRHHGDIIFYRPAQKVGNTSIE